MCRSVCSAARAAGLGAAVFVIVSATPSLAVPADSPDADRAFRRVARAARADDVEALREALAAVVRSGGARTAKRLLGAVESLRDDARLYWRFVEAAASFVDRPALEAVGEYVAGHRRRSVARDLLFALQRNTTRHVPAALEPALRRGPDDLRLLAAEALGGVRSPESVDLLVAALERAIGRDGSSASSRESPLVDAIVVSLHSLTGERLGASAANWRSWWDAHRADGLGSGGSAEHRTGTAVDSLAGRRRQEYRGLETAPRPNVVVLSARFEDKPEDGEAIDLDNDKIQHVLERMGISHEVVRREAFDGFDLSGTGALVINCAQIHKLCICPHCVPAGETVNRLRRCSGCDRHEILRPALTGLQVEKISRFVERGGYVFCEDWVLRELVEKAWPKHIAAGPKLEEAEVDVLPARGRTAHPWLRGIFLPPDDETEEDIDELLGLDDEEDDGDDPGDTEGTSGRTVLADAPEPADAELVDIERHWVIDDESFALRLQGRRGAVELLTSSELARQTEGGGTVAAAFRPGSSVPPSRRAPGEPGVVLCVLSHFGKQGSRADEHALENLLLQFLLDAHAGRKRRAGR